MTKQEQIEELASLMADCNTTCDECFEKYERVMTIKIKEREKHCQVYAYAKKAVEQGYHKILKGAVVLTKEECDNKVILNEDHFERALNYEREKARKETAKDFAEKLKERCRNYYPSIDHYCCSVKAVNVKDIDELLKEYEE